MHIVIELHGALGELTICFEASGNIPGFYALDRPVQKADMTGLELEADVAAQGHLRRVPDQAEASHVGHGRNRSLGSRLRKVGIEYLNEFWLRLDRTRAG